MNIKKFDPKDFLFIYDENEEEYIFIKEEKVICKLIHYNYAQGLDCEYSAYKVHHQIDGSFTDELRYSGKIPTFYFAVELFKNIFNEFTGENDYFQIAVDALENIIEAESLRDMYDTAEDALNLIKR